ncbi:SDR family oxidoreductase [Amycolatopsis endophytica]|uniref:Nucleoside-diphosphate-sugar epimerase n=1 Tax=Amycolatopsis endophytica TaxID=860233 RepID=A0A853B838_9PSEU|nr:SDR family oxidoreductase [Amycolatopsis endophytica]NYI90851.1 nucleoside-diphosphate-sugar epimerase [Amycolatopsis endophytica]
MRVFVTGATGFIGSAVVRDLLEAGHQVLGLARSDASASVLAETGAEVHRGGLDDLDSLRTGAEAADGVIHTAFVHDFTDFPAAVKTDRRAIETLGDALAGSGRPLVVTSGTSGLVPGEVATEESVPPAGAFSSLRFANEGVAVSYAALGVRPSVVRLPPSVHGEGDRGFVASMIDGARRTGTSVYCGDGSNRWAAVHRLDAARLFRLAVEKAPAGARLHGVGEEGVRVRDIAEVVGRHLGTPVTAVTPEEARERLGYVGGVLMQDTPASNERTRRELDWQPTRHGLIEDLEQGHYFKD